MSETPCSCQSGKSFQQCCEPFLSNQAIPVTAEQLMRSRYSAYSLGNHDYLLTTWHKSTCPQTVSLDDNIQWTRLTVKQVIAGTALDLSGEVEYIAVFKLNGRAHRLHEQSRFIKEDGAWFYVDGDILSS